MHPSVASSLGLEPGSGEPGPVLIETPLPKRALTEADAIEIWVARWLRVRRKDLVSRYGCDPRRLYEVWWGERFPAAREKAADVFRERYPALVDRTAFGYRRIPRTPEGADTQLRLFD